MYKKETTLLVMKQWGFAGINSVARELHRVHQHYPSMQNSQYSELIWENSVPLGAWLWCALAVSYMIITIKSINLLSLFTMGFFIDIIGYLLLLPFRCAIAWLNSRPVSGGLTSGVLMTLYASRILLVS